MYVDNFLISLQNHRNLLLKEPHQGASNEQALLTLVFRIGEKSLFPPAQKSGKSFDKNR